MKFLENDPLTFVAVLDEGEELAKHQTRKIR